jgi:carbon-monoxide dehydrogenase medium subunit
MLAALDARAVLRGPGGDREVTVGELILGHYRTCIEPDELLVEVRVPPQPERATYRKFRSRSAEDRPCVSVAAARDDEGLRVVVGAVAGTPQDFPELCNGEPAEVAAGYAERISPMSDARGSADYRKRVIAAEVRRAVEEVSWTPA